MFKLNHLGLPIFEPRAGGSGSSNDGNMSRRILRDHPDLLAEECNVPIEFVKGIYIIWLALASSLPICPEKFQSYCNAVKQVYLDNVGWYSLSPTLHKILEHGSLVLQLFPDSIMSGILSEEPAEASNKDVKHFQIHHARQDSYEHCNVDVFNRQMQRSDPKILHYFEKKQRAQKNRDIFPRAVLELCKSSEQIAAEHSLLD